MVRGIDACVDDDTVDLWMPIRKGSGRAAAYHSATICAKSELQPTFPSHDLRSLMAQAPTLQIHPRILTKLV
jgi:hypothetical protein